MSIDICHDGIKQRLSALFPAATMTIRTVKAGILRLAEGIGFSRLLSGSAFRRNRLAILCYHGISMSDEHLCTDLYLSPETFRQRLQWIRDTGCNVLGLDDALNRLSAGTLPDRSVVLTFDDGMVDFHRVALPIIESFRFPVTLYLSTYYMEFNRPVFDPMVTYMLWKAPDQAQALHWPDVLSQETLPIEGRHNRLAILRKMLAYTLDHKLSGRDKDRLLAELGNRIGVDYEGLCQKRVMHLMTSEEARDAASRGVQIEYHTHRHRVYRSRKRMFQELEDNRQRIEPLTARKPQHFCYTGGFYLPEHVDHLKEYGIRSAVTCQPGYCTATLNPLLLPRFVDTEGISGLTFRSWISGSAGLIPIRQQPMEQGQLIEEPEVL